VFTSRHTGLPATHCGRSSFTSSGVVAMMSWIARQFAFCVSAHRAMAMSASTVFSSGPPISRNVPRCVFSPLPPSPTPIIRSNALFSSPCWFTLNFA